METTKGIEIIERMMAESRKSLHRNSFYFILWAVLLVPAALVEYAMDSPGESWFVWPIAGAIGGVISGIYGYREGKRTGAQTNADRVSNYTWGGFGFALIFAIGYSLSHGATPHALILLLAGLATFISGGTAKFAPFVWGGIAMGIAAVLCGFVLDASLHPLVFAIAIVLGYFIPGMMLRRTENA
ncbi:MAG: hypothetical protein SchgKO_25600 [Schleiferiaceae bacterium]